MSKTTAAITHPGDFEHSPDRWLDALMLPAIAVFLASGALSLLVFCLAVSDASYNTVGMPPLASGLTSAGSWIAFFALLAVQSWRYRTADADLLRHAAAVSEWTQENYGFNVTVDDLVSLWYGGARVVELDGHDVSIEFVKRSDGTSAVCMSGGQPLTARLAA